MILNTKADRTTPEKARVLPECGFFPLPLVNMLLLTLEFLPQNVTQPTRQPDKTHTPPKAGVVVALCTLLVDRGGTLTSLVNTWLVEISYWSVHFWAATDLWQFGLVLV